MRSRCDSIRRDIVVAGIAYGINRPQKLDLPSSADLARPQAQDEMGTCSLMAIMAYHVEWYMSAPEMSVLAFRISSRPFDNRTLENTGVNLRKWMNRSPSGPKIELELNKAAVEYLTALEKPTPTTVLVSFAVFVTAWDSIHQCM